MNRCFFECRLQWKHLIVVSFATIIGGAPVSAFQSGGQGTGDPVAELAARLAADPNMNLNEAMLNAVRNRQVEATRWLLAKGAACDAADFFSGETALHLAVRNDDLGMTLELLQRGARATVEDGQGQTALELAKSPGLKRILEHYRDHPVEPAPPMDQSTKRKPSLPDVATPAPVSLAETLKNPMGMEFRLIPAGTFPMGSKVDPAVMVREFQASPGSYRDEVPRHRVRLSSPYYIGIHEVTVRAFQQFTRASGYKTDAERNPQLGEQIDPNNSVFARQRGGTWQDPGFEQGGNHPVVNVSWNDAQAFCRWLSDEHGVRYRLPTEAEWERACRAGKDWRFQNGDRPLDLRGAANVLDRTARFKFPATANSLAFEDGYVYTSPVGRFQPNEFGLFDMHGNVWEWCSDWYAADYYAKTTKQVTQDPAGPNRGTLRSLRGGCWY